MPGPVPKDPAIRQRTNRVSTRATLSCTPVRRRVPPLPPRSEGDSWHVLTSAWWRDVWRSPMAAQYLKVDMHALYRLAVLVDKFWTHPTKSLAAEITREQQCFGLTPIDRRRLEWIVEKVEQAADRKARPAWQESMELADDPRRFLSVVT